MSVHRLWSKHDWDVKRDPRVKQNALGSFHEEAKVFEVGSLEGDWVVGGSVKGVDKSEDVDSVGAEACNDSGRVHCCWGETPAMKSEYLLSKLYVWAMNSLMMIIIKQPVVQ